MSRQPTVTVIVPTFNESAHIADTLRSIERQTYADIVEILVADGRSTDDTRDVAAAFTMVAIVDNPERIQAAGLNHALAVARGDVIVRVDGHCELEHHYVERCVEVLVETGAAIVGGAMQPEVGAHAPATQRAIASAMASRVGAGPARFHVGGEAAWVDTVYLGAYWREQALAVGGYSADMSVNEDAEFAIRMQAFGGVRFDPRIQSKYSPRASLRAVATQFYRYGQGRAETVRRHPRQLRARQLAAPALVVGLLLPQRRAVAAAYASVVAARVLFEMTRDRGAAPMVAAALPVMHLSWGVGFLRGLVTPREAST